MNIKCKLIAPEGEPITAHLSTEHSTSSYNLPVLVIDGEPYGPANLVPGSVIEIPGYISTKNYGRIKAAQFGRYATVRARIRMMQDIDAETWLEFSAQAAGEGRENRDVVEQALREYREKWELTDARP